MAKEEEDFDFDENDEDSADEQDEFEREERESMEAKKPVVVKKKINNREVLSPAERAEREIAKVREAEDPYAHELEDQEDNPLPGYRPRERRPEPKVIRQEPRQEQREQQEPQVRFNPYSVPERFGIFDAETKQPILEAADANTVILAAIADILNRLDRIEKSV